MKIFLIAFLLLSTSFSWSQDEVKIIHFLRKSKECSLLYPGTQFNSAGFAIPVPDSIYSNAEINVKKVLRDDFRCSNYVLRVEKDTVRTVHFTVKSNKEKELFNSILQQLEIELFDENQASVQTVFTLNESDGLLLRRIVGRKWEIELQENPSSEKE